MYRKKMFTSKKIKATTQIGTSKEHDLAWLIRYIADQREVYLSNLPKSLRMITLASTFKIKIYK